MVTVMAFGTFDIFHKGHEHYLKYAKSLGDWLIVVVSRDVSVLKMKGKKPKNDENKRFDVIASKNYVDEILLGYPDDMYRIVVEKKPGIICLGYDQWAQEKELELALLEKGLKDFKIVRAKSFHPEKYKSSLLKKK